LVFKGDLEEKGLLPGQRKEIWNESNTKIESRLFYFRNPVSFVIADQPLSNLYRLKKI